MGADDYVRGSIIGEGSFGKVLRHRLLSYTLLSSLAYVLRL